MTEKKTKPSYNRHISICKFVHISAKENIQRDFSEKEPTLSEMFNIVVKICDENERLKKRIENLERNNIQIRRKTIDEYLSMNTKNIVSYPIWMNSLAISDENLKFLFSTNLVECLKNVLEESIDKTTMDCLPLKIFTQKQNTVYVFDNSNGKWRVQTSAEFKQFISCLSHRVLRKYLDWKKMNDELNGSADSMNETAQELNIQYMNKVNGFGKTMESRVSEIRKWMFGKIQISLKNIDF
jgi:hypothetical protein